MPDKQEIQLMLEYSNIKQLKDKIKNIIDNKE